MLRLMDSKLAAASSVRGGGGGLKVCARLCRRHSNQAHAGVFVFATEPTCEAPTDEADLRCSD